MLFSSARLFSLNSIMSKASICISEDDTLIQSLAIAKGRIQIMIDKGMDNEKQVLQGLIDIANNRIEEIKSGAKPALVPDATAKYYAEVIIDLDIVDEPMIADPDVNNADVSKRYYFEKWLRIILGICNLVV